MKSNMLENFGGSKQLKSSSEEALHGLPRVPAVVKNPMRLLRSMSGRVAAETSLQTNQPPLLDNHTMVKHLNPTSAELVALTTDAENDTPGVNKADVEPALCREQIKMGRYQGGSPIAKRMDPHVQSSGPSCHSGRKSPPRKSRVGTTRGNHCGCFMF